MKLNPNEKKWWFFIPVMAAAVYSVFWMLSALGISTVFTPFSFPKSLLFFTSLYSFERFYSPILRLALAWVLPLEEEEKKFAP